MTAIGRLCALLQTIAYFQSLLSSRVSMTLPTSRIWNVSNGAGLRRTITWSIRRPPRRRSVVVPAPAWFRTHL